MSATFQYTARSYDGEPVTGTLVVPSRDRAVAHLAGRALHVTSLRCTEGASARFASFCGWFAIDRTSRATFMRSMAALLSAGVALRRALAITSEQCPNARLAEALRAVAADLDEGSSLADAVARRPREFNAIACGLIRAGERSGSLDEVFARLATWTQRDREVHNRVAAALAYPALVTVAATALLALLLVQTVPVLAGMFAQMGVPLPGSTRLLLTVGQLIGSPRAWLGALGTVGLGIVATSFLGRTTERERLARVQLRVPVLGNVLRTRCRARFARGLSMLLQCGVEMLAALRICEDLAGHAAYRSAIRAIASGINEGQTVSSRLEHGLFDPLFVHLVRVGEESGTLDALLGRLADIYESDADALVEGLSRLVEPILIVVLGVAVGSIAACVLIPFYSLLGSLR